LNALTKAFVVVVTILSVVLVALVIPFAARVPDYASQYEQMQLDRDAQLLKAQEAAAEVRNAIAAKGSELETALASITELTAELDRANNDKSALEARLAQAQLTVERNSAAMQIAAAESQSKSQRLEELNNLINQQLSTISDLTSQRSDLSQSLIELRSDNRRLTSNYRRIQEQNKSLEQQLLETNAQLTVATEKLAGFVEDVETELASVVNPPVDIRGSVTNISQITDGLTFVQVNVGTRDLVKEGMEFTVYRGDSFVGKIKIASVDTAESVGQLTLSEMNVQEGDLVRAGGR
jgi:predicted RNase H-like nuclease (RuvC/YqgF family)